MNDTIGGNRSLPSRIVFEIIPRLPGIATELPNQKEQKKITAKTPMEMNAIIAEEEYH